MRKSLTFDCLESRDMKSADGLPTLDDITTHQEMVDAALAPMPAPPEPEPSWYQQFINAVDAVIDSALDAGIPTIILTP